MDNFALYHNLCNLYSKIKYYSQASPITEELCSLIDQFSSRVYRVAVVGEFKRGKSSLINSLLGAEILPTDILPTTAVINRIVYDTEQRIIIYYKNGDVQESDMKSLAEYATKLDKKKEAFAETIREIVVYYPSVFGQNRIELIDTPGLNDNESMTEATLSVLNKVDTAIVVISATMPLSMTEQNLICDLIKQEDIYHLTFVITFIDRVSDDEEDQERVIALIRSRLRDDTYQVFCRDNNADYLIKKADRILKKPAVFAVSSKLAIQGFVNGDNSLIEKSRFKHFKFQLFALLTANQEKDRILKIERICTTIENDFPKWVEKQSEENLSQIKRLQSNYDELNGLLQNSNKLLNRDLIALDEEIEKAKKSIVSGVIGNTGFAEYLKRIYISHLSALTQSNFCEKSLKSCLNNASEKVCRVMEEYTGQLEKAVSAQIDAAADKIDRRYKSIISSRSDLAQQTAGWKQETSFPKFDLSAASVIGRMKNLFDECIPYAEDSIHIALSTFEQEFEEYIASWRLLVLKFHASKKEDIISAIESCENHMKSAKQKLETDKDLYDADFEGISEIISNLKSKCS